MRTSVLLAWFTALAFAVGAAQEKPADAPVDFSVTAQLAGPVETGQATLRIHIDRYLSDLERTRLLDALRRNGYQSFLPAFRKTPVVGYVQIRDLKWDLRWAHRQTADQGQTITVATDRPIYFVGGGLADAKPRAGYEMAIIRLDMDGAGGGKGSIAAAARVKPSRDGQGVQVDDYADQPTPITAVKRTGS